MTEAQRKDVAKYVAKHLRRTRGADPRDTWVYAAEEVLEFLAWAERA